MKKFLLLMMIVASFCAVNFAFAQDTDIEENNYLKIERTQKPLKSRLENLYDGYEYTIKNIGDSDITIKRIDLWYNANGKVAYLSVKKSNKVAMSETFSKGKKLALSTLGLSLIPYGVAAPISAIKNDIGNTNAEKESEKFDQKPTSDYVLEKGKSTTVRTMAMKRYTPMFKLIYINPITDENMEMLLK